VYLRISAIKLRFENDQSPSYAVSSACVQWTVFLLFVLLLLQTVPLSFPFIFYGHEVKQVTIATGGKKEVFWTKLQFSHGFVFH